MGHAPTAPHTQPSRVRARTNRLFTALAAAAARQEAEAQRSARRRARLAVQEAVAVRTPPPRPGGEERAEELPAGPRRV